MLDNPFSCRCVRRNCQESYFRKAIICPKMSLSDGRLFAAHGRICKFYPSLAPLHEGSFGPLHTQRGLLKPHFGNAKDGSNGIFRVPYRSNFRFGRRRPLFFIFIACESLFGCRVVFARTDHLQGFSRISSHPVCRPSTVACTGISIHTPGVRVCGSSG